MNIIEYLKLCDNATFFHTPMWLNAVKYYWGLDWFYEIEEIDGTVAVMPLSVYTKNECDYYFSTFKGYGGVLFSNSDLKKEQYIKLEKKCISKYPNIKMRSNPLSPCYYEVSSISTVDVGYMVRRGCQRTLSRHHRRNIKIANNNSIMCRKADPQEWRYFYENCYLSTVSGWQEPSIVYDFSLFLFLQQYPNVELYVAEYNGKIIAGIITLSFNKHAHFWLSGIDAEFKKTLSMYLLINEMFEGLLPKEIEFFDLGVSGNNENILQMKRGFGGEKYESIQYITSPDFKPLKKFFADIHR